MKTPNTRLIGLLAALAVVFAACGSDTEATTTTVTDPPPLPIDLAGTRWVATGMFLGAAPAPFVPGAEPTLDFDADGRTLGGSTGCNSYGGEYQVDSGGFTIGPMSMTEMACEEPLMVQESRVLDILREATFVSLVDGLLTVGRLGGSALQFVDRSAAIPHAELTGTRWIADTIIRGSAASTMVPGTEVTLQLDAASSQGSGSAGCNDYGVSFESDRTQVTFGEMITTEIVCDDPAVMEQEAFVLATMQGELRVEIEGNRLTLIAPTGDGIGFLAEQ